MKKKNKLILIIILAIVLLLLIVFAIVASNRKDSSESISITDTVTDEDTKNILENEVKVTFGSIKPTGELDTDYYVDYTLENITKRNHLYNFEVKAYDSSNNIIGEGYITETNVSPSEKVSNQFILVLSSSSFNDFENITYKITMAYSEVVNGK